jgi:hypothetical protein
VRWALLMLCSCGRIGFDFGAAGNSIDAPRLLVDAPMLALDAGECPPSYMHVASSCYRASATTANEGWLPGEVACEGDAVGAHLVVIDDAAEYTTVQNTFGTQIRTWIGLSKLKSTTFLTVIDTDGFRDLTSSQTETSEDCAAIDTTAHMGTHTCGDLNRYICEYDGIAAVPAAY